MKNITKAVIPVAGFGTRFIPFTKALPKEMLPIIDTPTIQLIVEEAVNAGITDIIFITAAHSNKRAIEDHFDYSSTLSKQLADKNKTKELEIITRISSMANIHYIRQREARGLGDAIYCAKAFIGDEPFAVLLGDDVVVSEVPAIKQLIEAYDQIGYSQIGVQTVDPSLVSSYGVIASENDDNISKLVDFVEKPTIEEAPSNKAVLGRYILTPTIFKYLEDQAVGAGNEVQLTDAIRRMMDEEPVYGCVFSGNRYDIGSKIGFLKATVDFGLNHPELKDEFKDYLKNIDVE